MPGYANGKIYKILNNCTDDIYIGSTTQMLCQRMRKHRNNSKYDSYQNIPLYKCFREHGIDIFYIELIENYPCESKEELTAKEGQYIRELKPSLNKVVIGRTRQEWKQDNAEHIKIHQQNYRDNNKDIIRERQQQYREHNADSLKDKKKAYSAKNKDLLNEKGKAYYEQHKESIKEKQKIYRLANQEAISARKKEQVVCVRCGVTTSKNDLARHYRSKKCQSAYQDKDLDLR